MKLFQIFFEDIKKGENIDLYLTVVAAIILAILNLFSIIQIDKLIAVNMAIMTLMTVAILGNRHRIETLLKISLGNNKSDFLEDFPTSFSNKLDNATEIIMVGTHLSSILTSHHKVFEQKLKKGHLLKFRLINPNGSASKMATMRFPGVTNPDKEKSRIISSIEILSELKKISSSRLQIKTIDFLFDYTAYLFEPNNSNGVVFIERHTFKTSGGIKKPKAFYEYGDGKWFGHLKEEIEMMWDNAEEWKFEKM